MESLTEDIVAFDQAGLPIKIDKRNNEDIERMPLVRRECCALAEDERRAIRLRADEDEKLNLGLTKSALRQTKSLRQRLRGKRVWPRRSQKFNASYLL